MIGLRAGADHGTVDPSVLGLTLSALLALPCFVGADEAAPGSVDRSKLVLIGEATEPIELDPYLELLEDVSAEMTFETIRSASFADDFGPAPKGSPNLGFTTSTWWVRFTLVNGGSDEREMMLRQDYPLIDYVDLWESEASGDWKHYETGDRRPFAQREIEHRDFVFPIRVAARSRATYYMRFQSSGPVNISLSVYRPPDLIRAIGREQLALGIYYGGFIVLVVYNFFIFAVVRDRAFAYYLLYVMSYGTYMAIHNGLTYQFFWPESPWWGNQSLVLLLGLSLIWGLQFSRKFLDTRSHAPRLHQVALALQIFLVVGTGLTLLLPYRVAIVPASIATLVTTILILTMGTVGLLAGYRPARFFMLAWITLLAGVIVYMLKTFGFLPHTTLTQNGFQIGSLMEMTLLSLALASRVEELKKQSLTDSLTSLFNRRFFGDNLEYEFGRAARYEQPLSLLMIDIDHFKQFNDKLGHARGDEALREVATQLRDSARKQDIVCRYGGEEFSIVLPATDRDDAVRLAERLRAKVESEDLGGEKLTVSIGVASRSHGSFETADELFEAADRALYSAKTAGRNRVVEFRSDAAESGTNS